MRPTYLTAGRPRSLLPLAAAVLALSGPPALAQQAGTFDTLLEKLKEKGVLSEDEYEALKQARDEEVQEQRAERRRQALRQAQEAEQKEKAQEAEAKATKFDVNPSIRSMQLFGDLRLRYEGRDASSPFPAGAGYTGTATNDIDRERWRYAARIGIRGDLTDQWFYGLRLETGTNNRSPWVTFGGDTNLTTSGTGPSTKVQDTIQIGQAYVGWRPTSWVSLTLGKQPNPFYTTPMVWDPDIQPEGISEKFSYKLNDRFELFGNFAQIVYQDLDPDEINGVSLGNSVDPFLLGWQAGGVYKFKPDVNFKAALSYYNYTNTSSSPVYTGDGPPPPAGSSAAAVSAYYGRQAGINNLSILSLPWEFNFPLYGRSMRFFGDFATNLNGDTRAQRAAQLAGQPLQSGSNAYQLGVGYGNLGLVYGTTAKKGTWEVRTYWQRIEQYALDTNLIDSDFFEGRANLQGLYVAGAYSFTDAIIGTLRYGYAQQINKGIQGTGGSNPDIPFLNPIQDYRLFQVDLTWRF